MIGIITFNCAHQKTAEIIERCSNKIRFICTIPFKERLKRKVLLDHRPYQLSGPTPQEIGKAYSIDVIPLEILILLITATDLVETLRIILKIS